MDKNSNSINWFEIPALDISRAQKFYENIFAMEMIPLHEMPKIEMVSFPAEMGSDKVTGALVKSEMHKPSVDGPIIYLNANPSIQAVIDRIEKEGGKIIFPKTEISPEIGYMAFFIDSEGNRIGLHAQK
ncbi:MAG: VOC family protein [Methanococcaceae archaeon]